VGFVVQREFVVLQEQWLHSLHAFRPFFQIIPGVFPGVQIIGVHADMQAFILSMIISMSTVVIILSV
jgi:hypothetical protein